MADLAASPTDLVPARSNLPVPTLAAAGGAGQPILERLKAFARQPAVARSLPALGLTGVVGAAALAWATLHTPPQKNLFAGLADADKAAVADTLNSAGIPYAIDRDTGALSVGEDQFYQAKMLLAQAGLPKAAPDGDAMISALPMGASRAVEGERLRGAREMDLARTIEAIDAVASAKVHLAVEQPSVFLRDQAKPAASVMLRLRAGRALSDAQVQAIVNLVASSVPGLSPDGISVVDQSGKLLTKNGVGDDAATKQVQIQSQIEERYRQALNSLLGPIVGEGNFTAEVHADLDFAEVASTREIYPKDTAVVRQEQGSWTNNQDAEKAPTGIPGALANQAPTAGQLSPTATNAPGEGPVTPPTPGGQASAAVQNKVNESYNRTFDIGREVSVTRNPVGTVRRISVAVALKEPATGKKRSAAEIAALEALVKGAVGFDQARGDVVALSARAFAPVEPEAPAKWYEAEWLPMVARNLGAVLVALILVFGFGRPFLKKRARAAEAATPAAAGAPPAAQGQAEISKQIAAALADQASTGSTERKITLDMIEGAPGYTARAALIRDFVRQDPDRAALVVRDLIRADMPKSDKA